MTIPVPPFTASLRADCLVLLGELDLCTATQLAAETATLPAGTTLTVQLSGLTFLDVAGVNALLALHRRLAPGGGVVLRGAGSMPRRIVTLLGLEELLVPEVPTGPAVPLARVHPCASSSPGAASTTSAG